jgi:hypothetical protein
MTTTTTIKSLGFDFPFCLLDHSLSDFSFSPFSWMKILYLARVAACFWPPIHRRLSTNQWETTRDRDEQGMCGV